VITRSRNFKKTDKARSIFDGIPGYTSAMSKTFKSILAYSISDEAKFRMQVIDHFKVYGLESTRGAFKVSRATIFRWKKEFRDSQGRLQSLISKSRTPIHKRQMETDLRILEFIKNIRDLHCRIGKDKIKPLLNQYCLALGIKSLSTSTIGKVIKRNKFYFQRKDGKIYHNPNSGHANRKINYKDRVKKSPVYADSGYLDRVKAYVYHAVDIQNKFAFAYTYPKLNSQNTVDFLDKLKAVYPLESGIKTIQSDNGLEFMGDFDQRLKKEKIQHLFIYPRCPKINGFIERANRSLREEFLNQNQDLIIDDFGLFNQKLLDHLFWYNTVRPHQALKFLSPIDYLVKRFPESQMYVTSTII
jgi:transposase InsO family protein